MTSPIARIARFNAYPPNTSVSVVAQLLADAEVAHAADLLVARWNQAVAFASRVVRRLLASDGWVETFGLRVTELEAVYQHSKRAVAREAAGPGAAAASAPARWLFLLLFYFMRSGSKRSTCAALWSMSAKTHKLHTDAVLHFLSWAFEEVIYYYILLFFAVLTFFYLFLFYFWCF